MGKKITVRVDLVVTFIQGRVSMTWLEIGSIFIEVYIDPKNMLIMVFEEIMCFVSACTTKHIMQ